MLTLPLSTTSMMLVSTLLVGSLSALAIIMTDQLGYPVVNSTVVSFTTNLGSVSPVTVTAMVGSLSTAALVTFTHCSALANCNTGLDKPEHSHCNSSRCVQQPSTRCVGAMLSHQRPAWPDETAR